MLRSHRLAFLVGVFLVFERTRTRNPNKFILVRIPLYDNPTVMARLLHHQSRDALVAYAFRRNSQVRRGGSTLLTLLRGYGEEGRPPLLHVLASALREPFLLQRANCESRDCTRCYQRIPLRHPSVPMVHPCLAPAPFPYRTNPPQSSSFVTSSLLVWPFQSSALRTSSLPPPTTIVPNVHRYPRSKRKCIESGAPVQATSAVGRE